MKNPGPTFREAQTIRQPRIWAMTAILPMAFTLLLIWQVLLGHKVGQHPESNANVIGWTVFLWLIYLRLITTKLVTKVAAGKLKISMLGIWTLRKVALNEVGKAEVVAYRPVEDYGGYGVRLTKRGRAYIASGNRGVRVSFAKGGSILIGSQCPEQLAHAIAAHAFL